MTLTEEIYEKLMTAANDPVATEKVFHEYGGSKGPFYIALAKATTSKKEHLKEITQKCADADKAFQEKQEQIIVVDQKLSGINQQIGMKIKNKEVLDLKIAEKQTLLDEVNTIATLGFGTKQLYQLHEVLLKMAATQGVKTAEAALLFFNQLSNYQDLISLELEVKGAQVAVEKAKADVEFWQIQAKNAEAKSKARQIAVDFSESFIAAGVKQNDIPHWDRIITKAGVKPEKLANALEQYGFLEKLCQHRMEEEQKLGIKIKELTGQVKTLMGERQEVSDSINILRKEAVTEMVNISQKALGTIDNLAVKTEESINLQRNKAGETIEAVQQNNQAAFEAISNKALENMKLLMTEAARHADLEYQSGILASELVIARALKTQKPEYWKKMPFHSIREMLQGIIMWSSVGGDHNPALMKPSYPLSSKISFYSNRSASMDEVLQWVISNIYSDEERKAARNGFIGLSV
jgi:hypothetical protein